VVTEKSELSILMKTTNYFQNITSYIILASTTDPRGPPVPTTTASSPALLINRQAHPTHIKQITVAVENWCCFIISGTV
jgi:hypothetical protein